MQDQNAIIVDVQLDTDFIYYIGWNRPYVIFLAYKVAFGRASFARLV